MLVGRDEELSRIDRLLDAARHGTSAVLVLRGEAGIGKTALLEYAAASAAGMQIVRTRGIESESELAFSGLLELVRPLLSQLEELSAPQATALKGALALGPAVSSDPFPIYAGTLTLLAAAADEHPLLGLVDDAHWLDRGSAEALAFASRRLGGEGIVLLWAVRDEEPMPASTEGLEQLTLRGLEIDAALELLTATPEPVASATADALVDVTGGNPLALLELPQLLTEEQRGGLEAIEQPLALSPTVQQAFGRRLDRLPAETRRMLLVAAASDTSELATIVRACEAMGLDVSALESAERAGLASVQAGSLEFRHPLVRAAAYGGADAVQRRGAHRALAEALFDARAAGQRAWHQALASVEPDEAVAAALETTATRAHGRSPHAAARAYEQAARLSPDDGPRARRLLAAGREWEVAGRMEAASELLSQASELTADPVYLSEIEQLLARILVRDGEAGRAAELLDGQPLAS